MKKETVTYHCDVCKKEIAYKEIRNCALPVQVNCSQDDGMSCEPYIRFMDMDICNACFSKATVIEYGFRVVKGFKKDA